MKTSLSKGAGLDSLPLLKWGLNAGTFQLYKTFQSSFFIEQLQVTSSEGIKEMSKTTYCLFSLALNKHKLLLLSLDFMLSYFCLLVKTPEYSR